MSPDHRESGRTETPWRIELLGWLRAVRGDRVLSRFRTQKVGALLAYLAYHPHRSHPRDTLVELLWPEVDPKAGRNRLKTTLSSLRRQLEPPGVAPGAVIIADTTTIQLNPAGAATDVAAFEAALQVAARSASDSDRALGLEEAVESYQGELLPGYFEEWILPERRRLGEAHLQALRQLVGLRERQGDLTEALQWAHQVVAADPLGEEGHEELIRLLVAAGRRAAALRQYRQWERLAETAVGVEPAAELRSLGRELEVAVAEQDEGNWRRTGAIAAPLPSAVGRPVSLEPLSVSTGHLPPRFDRFFGREAELAALEQLVVAGRPPHRLVTLTGPGGSGKSRLAIEAAARLQEAFEGRVWFVPLLDLTSPRLIMEKVRDTLGLPRSPTAEPLDQVVDFLASPRYAPDGLGAVPPQPSLLVLDNFEHLVGEGAAIVETLRERVETLALLVTSRQRLGLPGEREFPVTPLEVPGATPPAPPRQPSEHEHDLVRALNHYPSVQLFVDRAQAVRPDFQVRPRNATATAGLCQRLEGLPLALELAAARAGVLTPAQMLTRLEQRFELLTSRQRTVDRRHGSLRATLDWSYQLLSPEMQRMFARLSVFRGGWTLEAAEAICGEGGVERWTLRTSQSPERPTPVLEYLEQLRESSLILTEERGGVMRYRLLETLREYGTEQLAPEEREAVARRHARYFQALVEQAEPELLGAGQVEWLEQLDVEHDNLRAALDWAVERGEAEIGLRLAGSLWEFWATRGYWTEGRERLARLLALEAASPAARAKGLACAGVLADFQGDYPTARALHAQGLALRLGLEDRWGTAFSLTAMGFVAQHESDYASARALQEEGLAIWRELGSQAGIAWSLNSLGDLVWQQGDFHAARALYDESLAIRRELGDRWGAAFALSGLGVVAMHLGEVEAARRYHEESLAIRRELGDPRGIAWSLNGLGRVAQRQGDFAAAQRYHEESLVLRRKLGDQRGIVDCMEELAQAIGGQGQQVRAVRLFAAAHALRQRLGAPLSAPEQPQQEAQIAALRTALGDAAFTTAWKEGEAMPWELATVPVPQPDGLDSP